MLHVPFRDGPVTLTAGDPGGTTGIATYDAEYIQGTYHNQRWDVLELGPDEHHEQLLRLLELRRTHNSIYICEGFDKRDNLAGQLVSMEYIGVFKLFGQQSNLPVVLQSPATGKGFWTDEKLKRVGLYHKGFRHGRDAMRHLLHYMEGKLHRKDLLEGLKA